MESTATTKVFEDLAAQDYKYGFVTDVEQDIVPKGLNEDVVRLISAKKNEPEWLLEWRLKAFRALADDEGADAGRTSTTRRSTTRHQLLLGAASRSRS